MIIHTHFSRALPIRELNVKDASICQLHGIISNTLTIFHLHTYNKY